MSTSADPRSVAFEVLARHESAEAGEVLLQALESDDDEARRLAAATVVKRRGQQSILEIIRRVDSLDDKACQEFSQSPERFRVALQQALAGSDDGTRKSAITFIRRTANLEQFAALLDQLKSADESHCDLVEATVVELASQLTRRLRSNDESIFPWLVGVTLRAHQATMLAELDARTNQFGELSKPEVVLRLVLILGGPDDAAVRNLFMKRGELCRDVATKLLTEDSHPALLDLLGDFLAHHAPPAAAIEVVRTRADFEFVLHLLKQLPKQPTSYLAFNLARLNDLPWLQEPMEFVERLPASVHDRLVGFINHAPVEEETKTRLQAWTVRQSGRAGREAASDVLKHLSQEEASQILHDALEDKDPEVEAWATHRLRAQKLPNTFIELLKRLDRDQEIVRDAARDELFSFDLNYLLKIFGDLSPGQSRLCGQALLKINPNAPTELSREIDHPFRRRRIRAIEAAEALGFLDDVLSSLFEKLEDPEASVRYAVIEALGRIPTPESIKAIRKMTTDPHRLVRDSAASVISKLSDQLKAAKSDTATHA
ncbi:MAG: HEAT repeat domain-containing protein [Planctomycetales bacterium]